MNIAVILAGGTGSRLGSSIPKQFLKVAGKTIIEHTVQVFESHPHIDQIAIVVHRDYVSDIENLILKNAWKKVKKILQGGSERYESTLAAVNAYSNTPNVNLIIHDAVRPLINHRIINDILSALSKYNAIDVAIPTADTIIRVDDSGSIIKDIPVRSYLRRGQTPQAFKLETIQNAYRIALKDPAFKSTDDCGTVVKYLPNEPVYVVRGEESNMKVTYPEDTYILDKLFQLRSSTINQEPDYSLLEGKVLVVFGGNSGIGKDICSKAVGHNAKVFSFSRSSTGTDISNREDVCKALKQVYDTCGRIDYVANSAAILAREPLVSMENDLMNTVISTNYNGMVYVAIESYRYLKESKGGLLFFTSSSYTRGRAFYSLYSSTKAATVNFMQAISQEWDIDGIKVNVINPERTKTPMRVRNFGKEPEETLLESVIVAHESLKVLLSDFTGQVIDVRIRNKFD